MLCFYEQQGDINERSDIDDTSPGGDDIHTDDKRN